MSIGAAKKVMPELTCQSKTLTVCLIGFGAIGQALYARLASHPRVRIAHVVVRASKIATTQTQLRPETRALSDIPAGTQLVLECAGHEGVKDHVLPALARGMDCALLSVGALSEIGLPEKLFDAARAGGAQLHVLPGAIGGMDAIAAARHAGLSKVRYTGRKPPLAWLGTPAQKLFDLPALAQSAQSRVIFEGSAREAASLYPKNANVAATISLAGLGLDATQVCLAADGAIQDNIHAIEIEGAFGSMKLEMCNQPLHDSPKTSMLTVLSALRFLDNCVADCVM